MPFSRRGTVVKLRASLISREIDKDLLILDPQSGEFFALNDTATEIMRLISSGMQPAQIAEDLSKRYEVDCHEALKDVEEMLAILDSENLVERE